MIRLAIETSTMTQSVAVAVEGQIVSERLSRRKAGHSSSLLASVEGALEDVGLSIHDVQALVCGLGPGSFTGVRVGLSFALGVAAGLGIPVYGVDSFRAFLPYIAAGTPVAVALDARKAEVYGVIYDNGRRTNTLLAPGTFAPEDFFQEAAKHAAEGLVVVGNGPDAFPEAWAPFGERLTRIARLDVPLAAGLFDAHDAGFSVSSQQETLEPRYIRPSDAEKSRGA